MSVTRITWEDLGNDLRSGRISFKEFCTYFAGGPASLHDIQVPKVWVVDHLGQNISVPTFFCSSWKASPFVIS